MKSTLVAGLALLALFGLASSASAMGVSMACSGPNGYDFSPGPPPSGHVAACITIAFPFIGDVPVGGEVVL